MKGNSGSKWHSSINRCKSENVSPITGFFSILFFLDVSTWASWTCSFIDLIRDSEKTCLMHESWKIKNTSNICFMVFRNCLFHCFLVVGVLCFNLDIYIPCDLCGSRDCILLALYFYDIKSFNLQVESCSGDGSVFC